ncbi:hypothetical protein SAMN04488505_11281 [Chitinophaga rupis]|uniref:Uncharacterized protein n=1 Tax=Chitinophaga rupis TaxID=573321 RepID=A0A1H8IU73_9BACT|nr:hypothetical protein [Chitinophaga rupis]SEN71991.1 hypothetical protein SAMN04488505_11281 [Chitinophaga rupis]
MTQSKRHKSESSEIPTAAVLMDAGHITPEMHTAIDDMKSFQGTPEQAEIYLKQKVSSLFTMAIRQMYEENAP